MSQRLVIWIAIGVLGSLTSERTLPADPNVTPQELPGREPGLESGYGHAHFPITCQKRHTQLYFDQGLAMLHGFAPRAAARSFQKALTLEPESPMSWCGMALATLGEPEQARYSLKQAILRRDSATTHEQAWIGALERCLLSPNQVDGDLGSRLTSAWKQLAEQYPDDIEAQALYVKYRLEFATRDSSTTHDPDIDDALRAVFQADPRHALHASVTAKCRHHPRELFMPAIEKACRVAPGNPHVWMRCGQTCVECGYPADAVPLFENALRQHHREMARDNLVPDQTPGYAETCDGLVSALAMCGRFDAALRFSRHMLTFPSTRVWYWDNQYRDPESLCVLGARKVMGLLTDLERWHALTAFAGEMDFLGPEAEAERRLAWCRAGFALRDLTLVEEQARQLLGHREYCESESQRLETEPRLKRILRDPSGSANDWLRRIERIDSALSEARPYAALLRQDLPAARAELNKVRLPDVVIARIASALGDRTEALEAVDRDLKSAPADARVANRCREFLRRFGDQERLAALESRWGDTFAAKKDTQPDDVFWSPPFAPAWTLADRDCELHSLDDYRGKPLLLVLYLGAGCPHCIEQLQALAPLKPEFDEAGLSVVTVSTDSIEGLLSTFQVVGAQKSLPFQVVSDESQTTFRAYGAWNDFQSAALHGVFLIDGRGRQLWSSVGKEPFMATRFLLSECRRLLARSQRDELQTDLKVGEEEPASGRHRQ
jgi:peroxiredoxin